MKRDKREERFELSISKEDMASLPAEKFEGEIVVVSSLEAIAQVVRELKEAPIVGFDTETKPAFKKGQINNVALIQLSTTSKCYLIRLSHMGFPKEIKEYLEDERFHKVGLSIKDDFHNLSKLEEFHPAGFTDLQDYVRDFHICDSSLTKVHSIIFGKRISKSQQLSNWEAPTLNAKQQQYAALDAYACINIYNHLKSGAFRPELSPYRKNICNEEN